MQLIRIVPPCHRAAKVMAKFARSSRRRFG